MEAQQLRILVVEPEIILRNALLAFLEAMDDLEPVGNAPDAAQAFQLCETLRPDVILMEVQLPDMDGIEAIRQLRKQYPGTAIVILTSANQSDQMRDALLAGATGWLEKWMSVDQVVEECTGLVGLAWAAAKHPAWFYNPDKAWIEIDNRKIQVLPESSKARPTIKLGMDRRQSAQV